MGMTATEGLPMGTSSGSIDPGAIFFMQRSLGMSVNEVEKTLNSESGLKGMSGLSNDVRTLLESSDPRAKFALDYFALKVAQHIALMAVSIGGIDGLVFTGGIGQYADTVRADILARIDFLKVPEVLVMPTDEERIMALQARTLLYGQQEQAA
jgi:acetate kinase